MIDKITFCVSTFERPDECRDTIETILEHYPEARILVADDSKEPTVFVGDNLDMISLPYDSGISAKRNALIDAAVTPYVMLMDDDNKLTAGSVERLYAAMQTEPMAAVAGMAKYDEGRKRWANTEGDLTIRGHVLSIEKPFCSKYNIASKEKVFYVEFLPLCFLLNTSKLRGVRFDESYKTCGEHLDFFLRLKRETLEYPDTTFVLFVPGIHFIDTGSRPAGYAEKRRRGSRYRRQMLKRWGITRIVKWAKPGKRVVYG